MVRGDFNTFGSPFVKDEGLEMFEKKCEEFNSLISNCNLSELDFKGIRFTYANGRLGYAFV